MKTIIELEVMSLDSRATDDFDRLIFTRECLGSQYIEISYRSMTGILMTAEVLTDDLMSAIAKLGA